MSDIKDFVVDSHGNLLEYHGIDKIVEIPKNLHIKAIKKTAFQGNKSIESVIVLPSITKLENAAFMGCENLKNITLPDTVEVIENLAFYSCKKLEKFAVPKNVIKLGQEAFLNCYNLNEFTFNKKLDIIEQGMFNHCLALEHIEIPGNIKEISDSAFNTCLGLKDITFNEGLEKICDHVFCGCKIKTLSFPSTLKLIGHETFWLADNIEEVLLKDKKNKGDFNCIIFGDAFKRCDTIKKFFVPEYISYSSVDFYNKNKDKICFLEDLDIDKLIESKRSLNNINAILTDVQRISER